MKVLFVSSGNHKLGINPIIKAQGESLKNNGIDLEYFSIQGKGIRGYLRNVFQLRKFIKSNEFDLIHSHYFLSSLVSTFSNPRKLVVSLMGSDVYHSPRWNFLIKLLYRRWNAVIVKSSRMGELLGLDSLNVVPNGVNFKKFSFICKSDARKSLGWNNKKYILFPSNSDRHEKNFELAQKSVELQNDERIELITLQNVPYDTVGTYLCAADMVLMTSKYEGSPNTIKEAMVCNCPIVATDVGDIKWLIGNTAGCYITSFDFTEVAKKVKLALKFSATSGRTMGRERIIELGLDSNTIAQKIITIYEKVLN